MAEFNSCNWCGKVYRLKKGLITGLVSNRKYCSKNCKIEAEGQVRFSFLHHPHRVLQVFSSPKIATKVSDKAKSVVESEID